MIKEVLDEERLKDYTEEDFKLEVYKSKGSQNPGLRFKGSQLGLLSCYAKLIETVLADDTIPAKVLHDILMYIADDMGKLPNEEKECGDV